MICIFIDLSPVFPLQPDEAVQPFVIEASSSDSELVISTKEVDDEDLFVQVNPSAPMNGTIHRPVIRA